LRRLEFPISRPFFLFSWATATWFFLRFFISGFHRWTGGWSQRQSGRRRLLRTLHGQHLPGTAEQSGLRVVQHQQQRPDGRLAQRAARPRTLGRSCQYSAGAV
jgi:hypothetical protein